MLRAEERRGASGRTVHPWAGAAVLLGLALVLSPWAAGALGQARSWNGFDTTQFQVDQPGTNLELADGGLRQTGGKDGPGAPPYRGVARFNDVPPGSVIQEFRGVFKKPSTGALNGGVLLHYQGDGKSFYDVQVGGGSCCGKPGEVTVHRFSADRPHEVGLRRADRVFDEDGIHALRVVRGEDGSWSVFVDGRFVLVSPEDRTYPTGTGGIVTYAGCCGQGIVWLRYEYRVNTPPSAVISPNPVPPVECTDRRGSVALDGSGSYDADGDALGHAWRPKDNFDLPASPKAMATFGLGTHPAALRVTDLWGASDEAGVSVVVEDTLPPSISLDRPREGAVYVADVEVGVPLQETIVVGPLTVNASASDQCGVASVVLRVDGREVGVDTEAPYIFDWDSGSEETGEHVLEVTATDLGENNATASRRVLSV